MSYDHYLELLDKDIVKYQRYSKQLKASAERYDELILKMQTLRDQIDENDAPLDTVQINFPIKQNISRGDRSRKIREYFIDNPNAKPKEVINALSQEGIDVSIGLVSSIKTSLKQKGKLNSINLSDLCSQILNENDKVNLQVICEELCSKGYEYSGPKGRMGFVKSVQETLFAMHESNTINYDKENKVYFV